MPRVLLNLNCNALRALGDIIVAVSTAQVEGDGEDGAV